jgi:hypothetical protein
MSSFAKFIKSFDPDSNAKGKQFEHFVKWFLKNDIQKFMLILKQMMEPDLEDGLQVKEEIIKRVTCRNFRLKNLPHLIIGRKTRIWMNGIKHFPI